MLHSGALVVGFPLRSRRVEHQLRAAIRADVGESCGPSACASRTRRNVGSIMSSPVAQGSAMKRRNPVVVWILLPLITLGIYHFVWYYLIHREMADFDRRKVNAPVAGPLLVLLLLGWTIIAPLISYYNTGNRIADAQRAAGLQPTCSSVVGLLLTFVLGLQSLYYQMELNKITARYNDAEPGTVVPLAA